jgi:hypothetical protein
MGIAQRLAAAVRGNRVEQTCLPVSGTCQRVSVGNEYYPNAYRGRRDGESVTVTLRPDPKNEYDSHAVALFIGNTLAGYLGSGPAKKFQPVIIKANRLGYDVQSTAELDKIAGSMALRLSLPWPNDLSNWLDLPAEQRARGSGAT